MVNDVSARGSLKLREIGHWAHNKSAILFGILQFGLWTTRFLGRNILVTIAIFLITITISFIAFNSYEIGPRRDALIGFAVGIVVVYICVIALAFILSRVSEFTTGNQSRFDELNDKIAHRDQLIKSLNATLQNLSSEHQSFMKEARKEFAVMHANQNKREYEAEQIIKILSAVNRQLDGAEKQEYESKKIERIVK